MEEVDKEISEMKLSLNARARVVAESYLLAVCLNVAIWLAALLTLPSCAVRFIRAECATAGHHPRLMMDGDSFAHAQVHYREPTHLPTSSEAS